MFIALVSASPLRLSSSDLIESRATGNVKFYLYTQDNPSTAQQLFIDDEESVKKSNFEKSRPTRYVGSQHLIYNPKKFFVLHKNLKSKHYFLSLLLFLFMGKSYNILIKEDLSYQKFINHQPSTVISSFYKNMIRFSYKNAVNLILFCRKVINFENFL